VQKSYESHKANITHSTNTDGVIIDPARSSEDGRGIIAWYEPIPTR
jgi:hypothetical protein